MTGQTSITTSSSRDKTRNYVHFEREKPGSEVPAGGGKLWKTEGRVVSLSGAVAHARWLTENKTSRSRAPPIVL